MKDFQATLEALGIRFNTTKPKTLDAKQKLLQIDPKSMHRRVVCTKDLYTCDSKKHIKILRDGISIHCCQCSRNNRNTK